MLFGYRDGGTLLIVSLETKKIYRMMVARSLIANVSYIHTEVAKENLNDNELELISGKIPSIIFLDITTGPLINFVYFNNSYFGSIRSERLINEETIVIDENISIGYNVISTMRDQEANEWLLSL